MSGRKFDNDAVVSEDVVLIGFNQNRLGIREVIGSIIRDGKKRTLGVIRKQARLLVPANDLPRFGEVALQDLQGLHEGNIARYGLRPSEFRSWLSNRAGGTVAKT